MPSNTIVPFAFQLLVTAFDTGAPIAEVTEPVTITVNKNLNSPIFDQLNYETTIYDFEPIGSSVITVNADDADVTSPENLVMYDLTDLTSNNIFDMFSIRPITGMITTRRTLTSENINVYRVRIQGSVYFLRLLDLYKCAIVS